MSEIVKYDTAKLAYEIGFPVFDNQKKIGYFNRRVKSYIHFGRTGQQGREHLYSAPTRSQLNDWLRNRYLINLKVDANPFGWAYTTENVPDEGTWMAEKMSSARRPYNNYELAYEAGLKETMKIIKSKI